MKFFVYIIYSKKNDNYYCGQTNNLEDRLTRHNQGRNKYTKQGMPWVLVKHFEVETRSQALRLESQIKKRGINRYLKDMKG